MVNVFQALFLPESLKMLFTSAYHVYDIYKEQYDAKILLF